MNAPRLIKTNYKTVEVGGHKVFYRQAGDPSNPTILMLHGYPGSSFMYRDLIPLLADKYHVVAPDMLGYGFSDYPSRKDFTYTFDNLTKITDGFTQKLGLDKYVILLCDYGSPIGFRLALEHPERVTAIISQNGCAYAEAISDAAEWDLWNDAGNDADSREGGRHWLEWDGNKFMFLHGMPDETAVAPETYALAFWAQSQPENDEVQLDLMVDFGTDLERYPHYHEYFRTHQPPLLAVWGKRDPYFLAPGAEMFKRDLPDAEVHLYESSHFALETHANEIAADIRPFLEKHVKE